MPLPPPSVWPQYLFPQITLTRLAGRAASAQKGPWTHAAIRRFIARYGVDMSEAANPDPSAYASFNDFFTRALRPDARPLAKTDFICPVDGAISQLGGIDGPGGNRIFQAKGHHYSTEALLGGDTEWAAHFAHGSFATLYLSPRDYHRIHMPCAGRLQRMVHVPGALFSVNPLTAQGVPGLFARNERLVCVFDCAFGPMALVLVGATIVGSMATVWHGVVNTERPREIRQWLYEGAAQSPASAQAAHACAQAIHLQQGQEMGRFLLGSTVVMLFPKQVMDFQSDWQATRPVRMGEVMGHLRSLHAA